MRTLFAKLNKSFFDYISKRQLEDAEQIIEKMLAIGLYKYNIYYYRGILEHEKGNCLKGLSYLNSAINIKPNNYLDYLAKGNIYYDIEKYKNALKAYQKAYNLNKENAIVCFNIAMSFWHLERYKEAIIFFMRAAQFGKKLDVTLTKFLGNSLEAVGQIREALRLYTKALTKFPSNTELCELKGDTLMSLDKFAEADKYYTKAIKINPNEHRVYYRKALNFHFWAESIKNKKNITKKQKLYGEALRWYDKCIRKKVEVRDSLRGKSECNLALKRDVLSDCPKGCSF